MRYKELSHKFLKKIDDIHEKNPKHRKCYSFHDTTEKMKRCGVCLQILNECLNVIGDRNEVNRFEYWVNTRKGPWHICNTAGINKPKTKYIPYS